LNKYGVAAIAVIWIVDFVSHCFPLLKTTVIRFADFTPYPQLICDDIERVIQLLLQRVAMPIRQMRLLLEPRQHRAQHVLNLAQLLS
ncbi:MAG: hypothetical protein KGM99_11905, partial [Burkholderiales bacterium]|nr:hypothetical protein [Burkholderiales bacterium]